MLNFGKYAAIAAAGLGLAALAAPSAEACGFVRTFGCARVSLGGWGHAYGMATAYRPVAMLRPVLAFRPVMRYRPVYGLAYHRPSYGAYGYAYHRPSCGAYGYAYHQPSYGACGAYGYAAPVRHYRPIAFRIVHRPVFAWAAPRIIHRVYHPVAAYGAAYGFVPRPRPIYAFGCGC
jgi:hypothetical protein